jgi:tetratricopeptide (TPR) repeat protein
VLDAFRQYEEAIRLAPTAPLFLETLGDRAEYVNFHALAVSVYEKLGNQALLKTARAYAALGDLERALEWSRRAVERNPYDLAALRALSEFLEQKGEPGEARTLDQRIAELIDDPGKRFLPPVLTFDPPRPTLEIDAPTRVGKTTIYDHSAFSVTMANPSARPVEILSVQLSSLGTGNPSGLGNIVGYWPFRHGDRWLAQGQALTFDKTWGFRVDTGHEQLSYVFDVCWRGEGDVKQCRSHRLDLFPR